MTCVRSGSHVINPPAQWTFPRGYFFILISFLAIDKEEKVSRLAKVRCVVGTRELLCSYRRDILVLKTTNLLVECWTTSSSYV